MTFNLRCASGEPPEHAWPRRRPAVRQLLDREHPDVLGTQEGLPQQLRDIQADLPAYYDSIGRGREADGEGEAMQVFFDTRRLRPLEHGHYWLSDTPDVPGTRSWGGDWPRMVTWIRFRDARNGGELYVANTHLEAYDATARAKSADLIVKRTSEEFDPDLPVLVTGDFNEAADPRGAVYDTLGPHGPFVDTWTAADQRGENVGTFHDYGPLTPDGDRIDWILARGDVLTRTARAVVPGPDEPFPSDHVPTWVEVLVPAVC